MPAPKPRKTPNAKSRGSGASEIAPGVFVGGWKDADRFEGVRFCVLDEAPPDMPRAVHVPIYDENSDRALPKNLDELARAMKEARSKGQPVLVFCGHGIRRSPLAGAWYLHRSDGLTLDEAYERVRSVRPRIETADEWLGNAAELEAA